MAEDDDSWGIWTASYLNIPVVLVRDEEEAVDRPATAAEDSADVPMVATTEGAAEDPMVAATEVSAEDPMVAATEVSAEDRPVEASIATENVPTTPEPGRISLQRTLFEASRNLVAMAPSQPQPYGPAPSARSSGATAGPTFAGILRAVPKRGPYSTIGRRVAARPADVASDATIAGSGVSQAAPPESAYAEPLPHRLQLFAPSGRRLTGRGLELRNRLIPMLYGGEEEEAETPQAYPMVGGPDSVDRYSNAMPPETPTIFGREYAVTAVADSQRLHDVAVEAAPLTMECGSLTEDLVERSERRRLQFQIASVYWFVGIYRGEIVDLLRNPESPLSLEEVLAYKCLIRCMSTAEALRDAECIPTLHALETAWAAGSLPRVLGVLSHSLLRELSASQGRRWTELPYKNKVYIISKIRHRMPPPVPTAPYVPPSGGDNIGDPEDLPEEVAPPQGIFANPHPVPSVAPIMESPGQSFPRGIQRAPAPSISRALPSAAPTVTATPRPPLLGPVAPPFPPPPPPSEDSVAYYTRLLRQLEAAITLMEALGQEVPNWPYSHLLILESKGGIPSARPSVAPASGEANPGTGSGEPRPSSASVDWDDI